MVIVVPAVELFVAFVLVFISCELADRISVEFEQICNIISTSNWYAFPISYSKMLPTILANAQEDVYFECFGSIPCNRETFKRVGKLINQQLIEYHLCYFDTFQFYAGDQKWILIFYDAA